MYLIEGCCSQKHLSQMRHAIKNGDTVQFECYGDVSLTELLPAMLTRYSETDMVIVAPTLPDQAADIISKWMSKQWSRIDGSGKMDVISHLTIITDLDKRESPTASIWKNEKNPFPGRLTLIDRQQTDTVLLLPDFAITGPVNMRYNKRFVATATTMPETVAALWEQYQRPAADATGVVAEPEAAGIGEAINREND